MMGGGPDESQQNRLHIGPQQNRIGPLCFLYSEQRSHRPPSSRAATQVGQITRPEPEPAPPLPLSLSLCCSQACTITMFDSCNNVAPCFRPERKKVPGTKKTEAHSSNIQREEGAEGRKEQRGGRSSLTLRGAWGRAERRAGHGGENGWWKVGQREQLRG